MRLHLSLVLAFAWSASLASGAEPGRPPNVVFILADEKY